MKKIMVDENFELKENDLLVFMKNHKSKYPSVIYFIKKIEKKTKNEYYIHYLRLPLDLINRNGDLSSGILSLQPNYYNGYWKQPFVFRLKDSELETLTRIIKSYEGK